MTKVENVIYFNRELNLPYSDWVFLVFLRIMRLQKDNTVKEGFLKDHKSFWKHLYNKWTLGLLMRREKVKITYFAVVFFSIFLISKAFVAVRVTLNLLPQSNAYVLSIWCFLYGLRATIASKTCQRSKNTMLIKNWIRNLTPKSEHIHKHTRA